MGWFLMSDSEFGPEDCFFMGIGNSVSAWYRCAVPCMSLGIHWIGNIGGPPDDWFIECGTLNKVPDLRDKKVVVLQQPGGKNWINYIRTLKRAGTKVLIDVDDDLFAVQDAHDHENRAAWNAERVKEITSCMEEADGIIVSTRYLAEVFSPYN